MLFPVIEQMSENKIDIQEIPQLWGFKTPMFVTLEFFIPSTLQTNPLPTSTFFHFPLATVTAEV